MSFSLCILAGGISTHPHNVCVVFVPVMSFILRHSAIVTFSSADMGNRFKFTQNEEVIDLLQHEDSVCLKRCVVDALVMSG